MVIQIQTMHIYGAFFFSLSLDWNPQQPQKMWKLKQKTSDAGRGKAQDPIYHVPAITAE